MKKALLVLCLPLLASAADLSGKWVLRFSRFGEAFMTGTLELKAEGSKLTGSLNQLKFEGTVEGDRVSFTATPPAGQTAKLTGRIANEEISGTGKTDDDSFEWSAKRAVERKPGPPQTHVFEPTAFHRVFAGSIAPVLRINPGDTVKTWTVDAGGRDPKGVRRSNGGNPETGPFYVEGAMPGDTLVVKFNRIRLNRDTAGSGDRIIYGALQPGYVRNAKFADDFSSDWKLDREKGEAMLAKPTERLKNFRIKMQPMLGCVGVAPPQNQSFRSGWLGPWGGNMDYNGLREGVTVYLPVFQEGALLFVGDGHALEGDGELTGDALETSMDVEFTVDLVHGMSTQAPRFENDEFLMASGIANSLNEALQMATTQLTNWLQRDYKLSPNEAHVILGAAIRYDIAEIVDPQMHIVAKVNKSVLAGLK